LRFSSQSTKLAWRRKNRIIPISPGARKKTQKNSYLARGKTREGKKSEKLHLHKGKKEKNTTMLHDNYDVEKQKGWRDGSGGGGGGEHGKQKP